MKPTQIQPHDLAAEQAILGTILLEGDEGRDVLPLVIEQLQSPLIFGTDENRAVYGAMLRLAEQGQLASQVALAHELRACGQAKAVELLPELMERATIAPHLPKCIAIVREMAFRRGLTQLGAQAADAKHDVAALADEAGRLAFGLAEQNGGPVLVKDAMAEVFEVLEQRAQQKNPITGVATGLEQLDVLTSGLQAGDSVLIGGRPGDGKTSLALNIAQHVGVRLHRKVLVLSLEMSRPQLVQRMLCSEAKVDAQAVRTGHLTSSDWHRLTAAGGRLSEAAIYIDDSSALTVLEARAKAMRMKAKHGLDLLIIDYLQLMRGRGRSENRQQEISAISAALKALAKDLKVPVVALSQLSRAPVSRTQGEHRPQLSDLRDSGTLEQDADVVMFLYRLSAYKNKDELAPERQNITEVIVAKQRNGPIGTVEVVFLPQYTLFENVAESFRQEEVI